MKPPLPGNEDTASRAAPLHQNRYEEIERGNRLLKGAHEALARCHSLEDAIRQFHALKGKAYEEYMTRRAEAVKVLLGAPMEEY